jgi:hypothetical protein
MPEAWGGGAATGLTAGWVMRWGNRQTHGTALVADLDAAQVEGVEEEPDADSDQDRVDLVLLAEEAHRGGIGAASVLGPQEGLAQLRRARAARAEDQAPLQRGLLGLPVAGAVIDALQPGTEELVELAQILGPAARLELDQELAAHGLEEALDLAPLGA